MHKKPFRPGIAYLNPHFGGKKSHEEIVADLKNRLSGDVVRRMAGELPNKRDSTPNSVKRLKEVRLREQLRALPAMKHPADAGILSAYRKAGRRFKTKNELFRFLEEKAEPRTRQTIEIRARELIKAGRITGFSK